MKNFVLDTNVLLHDPSAIFKFKDNQVIIPIYVIEEIDTFKKEQSERGRNARMIGRLIDEVRQSGNLANGVPLKTGGTLRVGFTQRVLPPHLMNNHTQDNRILALALDVREKEPENPTILVTKDINLRIRADVTGLTVEDYDPGEVDIDDLYSGYTELSLDPAQMAAMYQSGSATIDTTEYYPNQYAMLRDTNGGQSTALGRINKTMGRVEQIRKFKQDGVWGIRPRNKEQHFALDILLDDAVKLVTLVGRAGTGKAQPLDAKVLTPEGWRTMEQIEPGHQVMTPGGAPAKVLAVFPQGEKEIYKVNFSDGSSAECCKEHLWYTKTTRNRDSHKPGSVKSLEEIMGTLRVGKQEKKNHSIPMTKPVEFSEKELPLEPYLMGCLIGDGSMSIGHPSLTSADAEIVDACQLSLEKIGCRLVKKRHGGYDYSICCDQSAGSPPLNFLRRDPETNETKLYSSMREVRSEGYSLHGVYRATWRNKVHQGYEWQSVDSGKLSVNPVKDALLKLGLWGHRSENKFIPEVYLLGSVAQRIALLQGLMDTDGTIETRKHKSFSTTSRQLASDFSLLVQSLGGTVTIKERRTQYTYKGEKRDGQTSYNCNVCLPNEIIPFRLSRKLKRWAPNEKYHPRRYVESVTYVGKKQAKCILIDHPEHLYITDNFIVTHNTLLAIAAGLHKTLEEKVYHKMLVARPVFPMGKDIGYLPGTLEEKLNPWMQPIFDNVEFLLGLQKGDRQSNRRGYHELIDLGVLQIEPLTYIRGRSIPHQWMIVDEAQNLTPHEVKTIVTRAGEGTKIVFTGDPYQIDHPYIDAANNGLTYLVNKFKEHKLGGHLTLIKGERSELAELAANIL